MKITRLSLWAVDLTSRETYYMAEGKTCATVKTHVLRLDTDDGRSGWGEVCPIPHYLPAFADGVPSTVTELAGELLGADPRGCDSLVHKLDGLGAFMVCMHGAPHDTEIFMICDRHDYNRV